MLKRTLKHAGGYTLLEAAIALAVWAVLTAGVCSALLYTTRVSAGVIGRQQSFENARAALDAITVNIHMAYAVRLETSSDDVLKQLTLTEIGPGGIPRDYFFYFNQHAAPGSAKYHRLEFGLNDEFAAHIETVVVKQTGGRLIVTVRTDDELGPPVTLTGSADARYKRVTSVKS